MVRIRKKIVDKDKPKRVRRKYYSFLTIALLACIILLSYSSLLLVRKIFSYQGQIRKLRKIQTETAEKNQTLKQQLNDLDSRSYEAIARNNLKMSGEDEVLIIVHEPEQQTDKKKDKNKNKKKD